MRRLPSGWWPGVMFALACCSPDPGQRYWENQESRGFSESELRGEDLYLRYCVGCHGPEGNGQGPAAEFLNPKPRDFTRGVFKFRSTPSGSLPTDGDLMRTLTEGVHGTSMPSWRHLPEQERHALITYLKTFSPQFARRKPAPSVPIPGAPEDLESPQRVARGKEAYLRQGCHTCHGEGGKGDGPSAGNFTDSENNKILPFDFTRRSPKGGARPEDLYRTFMTGLTGTPMPSFADTTRDDTERWDIVAYVLSLRSAREEQRP